MSDLDRHLQFLKTIIEGWNAPSWSRILITENASVSYDPVSSEKFCVSRAKLVEPEQYSSRFDELLDRGYSWIHLNVAGILEGALLIIIELPRQTCGAPRERVAVNFGGPTLYVREDPSWDLSKWVKIES